MRNFTLKLLFSFCLLFGALQASAQMTQDFSKNEGGWVPTSAPTAETQITSPSGLIWKIKNVKSNTGYLMVNEKGYVILPAFDYAVASITVKNTTGCSTSAEFALYADGKLVEKKKLSTQNTEYVYNLSTTETGVEYKFVSEVKNTQIVFIAVERQTASSAIIPAMDFVSFASPKNGMVTKTLAVNSIGVSAPIQVSVAGNDAAHFTANVTELPAAGGEIELTYAASVSGTHEVVLNFASGDVAASTTLNGNTFVTEGTMENPFTLSDVFALNNELAGEHWVTGTMAGTGTTVSDKIPDGVQESPSVYNVALKSEAEAVSIAVELPAGPFRTALNVVDNPSNLGKTVSVRGSLVAYFGRPGVRNPTGYVLGDDIFTGIEGAQLAGTTVYAVANEIVVCADQDALVTVYTLTGVQVAQAEAAAGVETRIQSLPSKAIYLVKAGNKTYKVAL